MGVVHQPHAPRGDNPLAAMGLHALKKDIHFTTGAGLARQAAVDGAVEAAHEAAEVPALGPPRGKLPDVIAAGLARMHLERPPGQAKESSEWPTCSMIATCSFSII
jgi:hypothetical protein